ncbi:MAG: Gfo/Idh/MocA family oxidoreductase [Candidatus Caldatribacteriaceae bacterium]
MNSEGEFIALVGVGYWGKKVLRNLLKLGVLRAVCDTDASVSAEIQEENPFLFCTTSFEEVLRDPAIRALVIATPARTHYELARRALFAGKDVLVEKPLSMRKEEGKELLELARQKSRILMVGHILRYHPAVRKLKELVSGNTIGKPRYIYSHRLNLGKVRTEENVLWSLAPHDFSLILSILEMEPLSVSAFGADFFGREMADTVLVKLEFPENVKGHVFVSWLHPFKEQRLVVVGSEGMLVFDDVGKEKLFLYPHRVHFVDGMPMIEQGDLQVIPVEDKEPLKEELLHFIECVQRRLKPLTDGEEGLRVLQVLELAEESLKKIMTLPGGVKKDYFVHESSYVDEDVEIGEGTKIWHFCHVLRASRIGKNCIIGQNVMIGPDVIIGNGCKIQNNVSIYKGVTLEDEVFCGPACVFTNVYNPRAFVERKHEFRQTLVKRGATIGANATVVCGVTIGRYALVGAGAVVKKDIPDYALVVGVPARQIGWVCKCGVTLPFENGYARCLSCGSEYAMENGKLVVIKENPC